MTDPVLDMLDDTWNSRDFPVLREAARMLETAPVGIGVRLDELSGSVQIDQDTVYRSLRALQDAELVELTGTIPATRSRVVRVSAQARRLVGLWPTPESALNRMLVALEQIADNTEEEPDTRSRARKVLESLSGAGRQLGIEVAAAVVSQQLR